MVLTEPGIIVTYDTATQKHAGYGSACGLAFVSQFIEAVRLSPSITAVDTSWFEIQTPLEDRVWSHVPTCLVVCGGQSTIVDLVEDDNFIRYAMNAHAARLLGMSHLTITVSTPDIGAALPLVGIAAATMVTNQLKSTVAECLGFVRDPRRAPDDRRIAITMRPTAGGSQ
ncbi:hypothetical protein [uncultured Sphingomonas sp.]|uniref:hypothetical protein n=1 Tax=uncultured Sphingomonas sp. TaxID=158754 RepID=UPI0015760F73